jgi:lipopolysaccharide transport system permease protein
VNSDSTSSSKEEPSSRVPLVTIEARRRWKLLDFKELWAYRDLWAALAMRDIKVRYKQTVLGALWAILNPFVTMVVFAIVFGQWVGISGPEGLPYPIFLYSGLLPWTFFSATLSGSAQSVIRSSHIMTKVYFPRIIVPTSVAGYTLLDMGLASLVLVVLMVIYGIAISVKVLLLPFILLLILVYALGVGLLLAGLNVKFRDFNYIIPFLTPVIYPVDKVPEKLSWLMSLNPMVGLVESFRSCLLNYPIDWAMLGISLVAGFLLLIIGVIYFGRVEDEFADIV